MTAQVIDNLYRAGLDDDTLDLFITAFELYNIAKLDFNIYRKDADLSIPKNLILQYYKKINPNYSSMIFSFRRKYISNELLVEKNDTPEERKGLNLVYDFLQNFDVENDYFNIFITSLQIHGLLYKALDDKNSASAEEIRMRAEKLRKEAMQERNIAKLRESRLLAESVRGEAFGGQLRTVPVLMREFNVEVPSSEEVVRLFNRFLTPEAIQEYEDALNNPNIFAYIDYAVNTTADLIAMQPFADGNKRTFRSLLNLMFKKKNLPPVYITRKERGIYHDALSKAIVEHDYSELDAFYYYKICDSIYELDFKARIDAGNAFADYTPKVNVKK